MRTSNTLLAALVALLAPASTLAQDTPLCHNEYRVEKEGQPCVSFDAGAENCATIDLSWVTFDELPVLSDSITASVRGMLVDDEQPVTTGSVGELADAWFSRLRDQAAEDSLGPPEVWLWSVQDSISVHDRRGDLLTLNEVSYVFTGGAHGMPYTSFLHWDVENDREVTLDDLLVDDQEEAFWTLAREAHSRWAQENDLMPDDLENWPFAQTDEFYLGDDGLVLVYNVYELGPYAMGQQELVIPWGELGGIIKPEYLP